MTDQSAPSVLRGAPPLDPARVLAFARSEVFERTFQEGMTLVEETAAYLDGPGRGLSKRMSRIAALTYAGESMRLTTRLMQVASWLLVQRAIREGQMTIAEASGEKYRLTGRDAPEPPALGDPEDLPAALRDLMERGASLFERVRRLDADMYAPADAPNVVSAHMARLNAAFGGG